MPHEKARKTLSAEQKRAMCLFHEENPGTRQADIGARFGVERSTVSKVLRQKDQYLKRETESESAAAKRNKGKHPDFDRTLSNYVRRQQKLGFEVRDEDIMEQASYFARVSGHQETLPNSSWLQKFKQKHGIGAGRLMRRASETNIPDSMRMSTALHNHSGRRNSSIISPISPTYQLSPLSGSRSDEDIHTDGLDFDFPYRHTGSHSSTSLTSDLRENSASFSADPISPTAPAPAPVSFNFSSDPNSGAFSVEQNNIPLGSSGPDFQHRGKRSNTFPSINVDYGNQVTNTDPITPRHPSVAAASVVDSPSNDTHSPPFTIDTTLTSPPALRRSSSNSSMTARSNNTSTAGSAMSSSTADSSPVSPTQEEARRAANTLLSYIQGLSNGPFDQSEYITVVQLTKKLQIQQHQTLRPSIGGLSRIPEGDGELSIQTDTLAMMEAR
ncbi:hypothetical protein PT974_08320 [Cladobotryum mycophilum]|uniref:HTH CENPB-type domain-containing protein n=1 Tax=Cladobotryum mycophilum TaxID=491253 RepID=A0ABR0SD04_9HYPO